MTALELRDIVPCKLCGALLTYETRAGHIKWHARINGRLHTLTTSVHDLGEAVNTEGMDPRGPLERDAPCREPHPNGIGSQCVFPAGHETHWNGVDQVWMTTPQGYPAELAAARQQGRQEMIDALREDDRYLDFAVDYARAHPTSWLAECAAAYLESVADSILVKEAESSGQQD